MDPQPARSELERALDLAYRAVARRERTIAELRAFLERKRVGPATIEAVVAQLWEAGVLDDARYARRFAQEKRNLHRWGSERIARDLRRRGVALDLINAALAGRAPGDELATAVLVLERRFERPPSGDRERDRAWRLLVRRGYAPEIAYDAVRAYERRWFRNRRAA
jgi:regulatory protein